MIETVRLENWKSHHETELDFSSGVNALIGTMGSGKSSVLDAITFGLYGATPALKSREVTLDDVIRRTPSPADEAVVEVALLIDGERYTVKRTVERGKGTRESELRKEGELLEAPSTREVTEQVEKILGMGFQSFTRAVYSEQNELDAFLEMRPGQRKERIDELLRLDRFEEARQSIVKVENRFSDELEQRQQEIAELEDEIDREELESLEEEIQELEQEREELEEYREELEQERLEIKEELEDEKGKKQRAEELEERITRLETRQESVEERLEEKKTGLELEKPGEELEKVEEELDRLEQMDDRRKELEKQVEILEQNAEDLEEEIQQLSDKVEKFEGLEGLEQEREQLIKEIEEIKERGNRIYAERTNLEDSLEALEEAEGSCPTCGKELDSEHREELASERREEVSRLKRREKKLRGRLEKKQEKKQKLDEERDELMQHKGAEEKLVEKEKALEEKKKDLDRMREELENIDERFSPDRVEELEERKEEIQQLLDAKQLEEKKEALEEKLEESREQLEEVEYDEEKVEKLRDRSSDIREQKSVAENKIRSKRELRDEKSKRLEQMESQVEKLERKKEEVEKTDRILDFIHDYRIGLEDTQVTLRQRFVERLNSFMDRIWTQVYPYDDYYSIRLNAEEGYLLQLLDSENNWVPTQEVSGGERHSAALVMRLALTFALSPKIQVLILDEPTHNLDSSAVEELAETLRERTSDLIDQLFVVTHDPALEAAATGKLYQFEKKNTETGLTEVEEVD